ncbi:uncharacterized protein [Amphiura filiformis]|uniref:uncharacterized protein n=1 Tax=Amphiura filiformis TaxID=82378 RepID=UPI003B2206DE
MTIMREDHHVEGWVAVVVCILACLQLTSGWNLEKGKEPEQLKYNKNQIQAENNSSEAAEKDDEEIFVGITDEGPLSETQMKTLEVLLRRYSETGQESAETMITNLVNQVEKMSLHGGSRNERHKGGRRNRRQNGRGRPTRGPPRTCTFEVNVQLVYTGECRAFGQIPACDFPGNSTHQEEVRMLWVPDCSI